MLDNIENIQIKQLLTLYKESLEFQNGKSNSEKYFKMAASTLGIDKNRLCSRCGAATQRNHSDIQKAIWTRIKDVDTKYLPNLPELKSPLMTTNYWLRILPLISLRDLASQMSRLSNRIQRIGNSNPKMKALLVDDYNSLNEYKKLKFDYFKDFLPKVVASIKVEEKVAEEKDLATQWKKYTLEDFDNDDKNYDSPKEAAEALGVSYANYRKKLSRLKKKQEKK